MKIKFFVLFIVSVTLFAGLVSCEKQIPESRVEAISTDSLKYNRTVVLRDQSGKYYKNMTVSANSESDIDSYLNLEPTIKVSKFDASAQISTTGESSKSDESNYINSEHISIKMEEGNIPSGYVMEVYFKKSLTSSGTSNARTSESYYTFSYQDDRAKGVTTFVKYPYTISYSYYSRGCCWCSYGWYNRGLITHVGTYNYTYYSVPKYTSYLGVRFSYYTTTTAASKTSYQYIYG